MSLTAAEMPLSALLSQVLVAFTIEFDNEAERRIPHRTTRHGASRPVLAGARKDVWLTSMVMYLNCMRFVGADQITVGRIEQLARTKTNWHGMQRWGFVRVEPDSNDSRPKPPRADSVVRATKKGLLAREIWEPLFGIIEERWRERFGSKAIDRLRESLQALVRQQSPVALPDCMPILKYGLATSGDPYELLVSTEDNAALSLPTLLARALLAFALQFERESNLSLAISANVLRVLDQSGVRLRDLPLLTGVSKESISMAMGILEKKGFAFAGPDPDGGKGKVVRLTPAGVAAQSDSLRLLRDVETSWIARFGADAIGRLRESLEHFVGEPTAAASPLFQGLIPYPESWRAALPKPKTLPHFPMVLHRGGFPDGS